MSPKEDSAGRTIWWFAKGTLLAVLLTIFFIPLYFSAKQAAKVNRMEAAERNLSELSIHLSKQAAADVRYSGDGGLVTDTPKLHYRWQVKRGDSVAARLKVTPSQDIFSGVLIEYDGPEGEGIAQLLADWLAEDGESVTVQLATLPEHDDWHLPSTPAGSDSAPPDDG